MGTRAPGSDDDPSTSGASLLIFNPTTRQHDVFALPAAHWVGIGNPAGAKGYKYGDTDQVDGPCTKALLKPGKLLKVLTSGLPGEPPAGWGYSYMDHQGANLSHVPRRDEPVPAYWVLSFSAAELYQGAARQGGVDARGCPSSHGR